MSQRVCGWTRVPALWVCLCLTPIGTVFAQSAAPGQVRMSLADFQALQAKAAKPHEPSPPLPATISRADVQVQVPEKAGLPARAQAVVVVHVLGDEWTPVAVLPAGTALTSATAQGKPISLGHLGSELVWSVQQSGEHELKLEYEVPVVEVEAGRALRLPLPAAAALNLSASIPGQGLAVSVIPAAGIEVAETGDRTVVKASVPRGKGVQLSWRVPSGQATAVVGAAYQGTQKGEVVAWTAQVAVEAFTAQPAALPLLAADVALHSARVDGRQAVVQERDGKLSVQLRGAGSHRVELAFETQVVASGGPPGTELWLPRPPLGAFSLNLPGDKKLHVTPRAGVDLRRASGRTVARVHLPPSDRVRFTWSEALPAAGQDRLQANAEVYHVVFADEGVLQVQAQVAFQVTRGSTHSLRVGLPASVAVNQVLGEGVIDWRVTGSAKDRQLTIYLDRDLLGDLRYRVDYERLLGAGIRSDDGPVSVPLLVPADIHRQRGMVALLRGSELSMQPVQASGMNKVGENQLPAWVHSAIRRTVAHTYKYVDPAASLSVRLAPAERQRGRFDATVDSLYSVGDGVMKASASVEIGIKTGKLMDLDLTLPAGVNLVGVSAPSLRDHRVVDRQGEERLLQLMFTQELEGALHIEVAFERVLSGGQERVSIPSIHVPGAELEQGRLAVEALAAVEVQTAEAKRVLPLDVQELPRQLILRTTNPILLAFKYVHAEPPFQLDLEIKHHAEMQVQVAAIDRAEYQTLFTRHGLALTRAVYQVRNRRKQFLKVQLPEGSQLWSAGLGGQPVKPARSDEKSAVLLPLLNSAAGFRVEIVYATGIEPLGFAGWIEGVLPVPDIVETRSRWDVYLPDDLHYGRVDANMTVAQRGGAVALETGEGAGFEQALAGSDSRSAPAGDGALETTGRLAAERPAGVLPLRIEVPRRGVHFRFNRLFANRSEERSRFSIHYTSAAAGTSGGLLLVVAIFALAAALSSRLGSARKLGAVPALTVVLAGLLCAVLALWLFDASALWALGAVGVILLFTGARALRNRRTGRRHDVAGG